MSRPGPVWRDHFIRQFSVAISLLITLGVAALGFSANLLRDEHFRFLLSDERKSMFMWGLVFLSASVGCGVLALFLRVIRTRLTFKEVVKSQNNSSAETKSYEHEMGVLAKIILSLLALGGLTFLLGTVSIVYTIWVVFGLSLNAPFSG